MGIRIKVDTSVLKNIKDTLDELKQPVKRSDWKEIGEVTVEKVKDLASKGISPIKGAPRFPGYKGAPKGSKRKGYPDTVKNKYPSKRNRPVNLYLSGDFIKSLKSNPQADQVDIGFFDRESELKEQGHREGANGQPRRPLLPTEGSETFSKVVVDEIEKIIEAAVQRILDKLR